MQSQRSDMGVRRFGAVNWLGTWTLIRREVLRFMNVWSQTIMGPLVNAGLFLLIFTIPRTGHFDDDGDPKRLCQHIQFLGVGQSGRQYRGYLDAAVVGG